MGKLSTLKMYLHRPQQLDEPTDLYTHRVTLLDGSELDLASWRGQPTLFVNTATITSPDHASLTWGAAQAGVAAGVIAAVRGGQVPPQVTESGLLIVSVWVDPSASLAHQDAVCTNNRVATLAALTSLGSGGPGVEELMADDQPIWNPYYSP